MQSAQVHPEAERVAEEDSHPPAATRMAGAVSPFAAARAMERRMRTRRIALAALLGFLLASPARAGDATGAFAPYEDLLEVVADLTWHLHDDTYRFPAPKDPTGHDVFRLSLQRIENWEKRYPGRLRDVTAVGRAEALEHLSEYAKAAELY